MSDTSLLHGALSPRVNATDIAVSMQSAGDSDWFKIVLTAGTTYTFTADGLTGFAALQLVSAAQAADHNELLLVQGGYPEGVSHLTTFTPDTSGTYYFEVDDYSGAIGSYDVSATIVADSYTLAHPGTLTVGTTLDASMQSAGDYDWFKISLTAGTTYKFTEDGLSQEGYLQLVPATAAVDYASFVGPALPAGVTVTSTYTANATGSYYVEVEDPSGDTGAYTLGAAVVANSYTFAHPGVLAIGTPLSVSMQSLGDTDWFKVSLTAGDTYTFTEDGLSAGAFVEVVAAANVAGDSNLNLTEQPATLPNGATLKATYSVDTSGTYYLLVSDQFGRTGAYTIGGAVVTDSYTLAHPGALTVGAAALSASMQSAGDTDWFKVTLTAGTTYTFTEDGLTDFAQVFVYSGAGADFVNTSPSPATKAAGVTVKMTYTADTTGSYDIALWDTGGVTGKYTFGAAVVTDSYTLAHPGALTVGAAALSASMQSEGDVDWFKVTLTAGTTYTFTEDGLTDITLMYVVLASDAVDTSGNVIDGDGAGTGSNGATLKATYTADTTGVYYLRISDQSGPTGAYTVSAAVVADSYTLAHPGAFAGSRLPTTEDFNGDGKSDFLIENTSGAVAIGEVTKGAAGFTVVSSLGSEWSFKGEGDFLGNGKEDFLIQDTAGAIAYGEVSGSTTTYTDVTSLGPEWKFVGTGDFLGEGHSQFLIENTSGALDVGDFVGGKIAFTPLPSLPSIWSFRGAADYLGDGKADFLIQNTSGDVEIGEVGSGGSVTYTGVVALGAEWKFVGAGDYLGESHDQFLIQNTSGVVEIGDFTNGKIAFTGVTDLGSEWKFVGNGDFLGEGHDQFLIQNTVGQVDIGDWTAGAVHFTQVASLGSEWVFH